MKTKLKKRLLGIPIWMYIVLGVLAWFFLTPYTVALLYAVLIIMMIAHHVKV